jgi:glycosyltransferase involved in cell wall biosynthesis
MRILHVIIGLDFADGGPPVIATRLAAAQAKMGHEVGMACYTCPADAQTTEQLKKVPNWEKVRIHYIRRGGRLERWRGGIAAMALEPLIAEADVVHLHNVWEVILLRAAEIARDLKKPYLILLNGMLSSWAMVQSPWKKRMGLALGVRRMVEGSAYLHLGNESERKLIAPLGLKAPSVIIPNGVMLEEIDPLPERGTFAAGHPELGGRPYVLFLSRLNYKKGMVYLAKAFALLAKRRPDIDLVVAGPDGGERGNFERLIAAEGVGARVHVVGPLYGKEKFAAMVDCECFVLPSLEEGFSVAVLEALAAGAPVVISEGCHFPQVATAGAGKVVALDAGAVAKAMEQILGDPDRAAMGRAGRALVEANYTWDVVARRTVAAYQQAIGEAERS